MPGQTRRVLTFNGLTISIASDGSLQIDNLNGNLMINGLDASKPKDFGHRSVATNLVTGVIGYYGGYKPDGTQVTNSTVTLTGAVNKYIYLDGTGTVTQGTSVPAGYYGMMLVPYSGGAWQTPIDIRNLFGGSLFVGGGAPAYKWTTAAATIQNGVYTYNVPSVALGKATLIPGDGNVFYTGYTVDSGHTQVTFTAGTLPAVGSVIEYFYSEATAFAVESVGLAHYNHADLGTGSLGEKVVSTDPATGAFPVPVIPTLPISKTTGLQAALDGKADDADITALDARVDALEASGGGGGVGGDPTTEVVFFDDFFSIPEQIDVTNTYRLIGDMRWAELTGNTPSTDVSGIDSSHPGVLRLRNTGQNQTCGIYHGATASWRSSGGALRNRSAVYLAQANTGAWTFELGVWNQGGAFNSGCHGMAFEAIGGTYANWQIKTANGSSTTRTDSGVALAASTWFVLEWEMNTAGTSIQFWINGTSVGTITTTLPVTSVDIGPRIVLTNQSDTNTRTVHVDYYKLTKTLSTAR